MDELGWDSCDIILRRAMHTSIIQASAWHWSVGCSKRTAFGGILDQPDFGSAEAFRSLGPPNLFWGVTGGNMDSMVNRYTSDRRIRSDDAYSPSGVAGLRPDRAVMVYTKRCREAFRAFRW